MVLSSYHEFYGGDHSYLATLCFGLSAACFIFAAVVMVTTLLPVPLYFHIDSLERKLLSDLEALEAWEKKLNGLADPTAADSSAALALATDVQKGLEIINTYAVPLLQTESHKGGTVGVIRAALAQSRVTASMRGRARVGASPMPQVSEESTQHPSPPRMGESSGAAGSARSLAERSYGERSSWGAAGESSAVRRPTLRRPPSGTFRRSSSSGEMDRRI